MTGLRQSVKDFGKSVSGVSPQDVLELMLIVQYYDMLREVRQGARLDGSATGCVYLSRRLVILGCVCRSGLQLRVCPKRLAACADSQLMV